MQSSDPKGHLLLFPWLQLERPLTVAEYSLVPYERGGSVEDACVSTDLLDRLTKRYLDEMDEPISHATLLRVGGGSLVREFDGDEHAYARGFAQVLAFSALSSRSYCRHTGYWNADNFRLESEFLGGLGAFVSVVTRMRHGAHLSMIAEGHHFVRKPEHVQLHWSVDVDIKLLEALFAASSDDAWPQYWQAAVNFNLANTDATYMSARVELVLLCGAIERILGCASGKEHELATSFLQLFEPRDRVPPKECPRLTEDGPRHRADKYETVTEHWVRDLAVVRGDLAHGRVEQKYVSKWTAEEHLLLGSFALPLLVKLRLCEGGYYELTDEDHFWIDTFECLASAELLKTGAQLNDAGEDLWGPLVERARARWTRNRIMEDPEITFSD